MVNDVGTLHGTCGRLDGSERMRLKITVLPGDGIGPEVIAESVRALRTVADSCGYEFCFTERVITH